MAGKRKGITEEMVIKDSDEDLKPRRAKKKNLDKDVLHTEQGQLDAKAGKGNKRKRPVPKEEKKRKQLKLDEETNSETRLSLKEQKERKKPRGGKEASSDTGLDGDESDTAATTSGARRYDQDDEDDEDDDRDSTSQKDQADEDEPMDCEVDPISDISLPTSMLKPEGSRTHRGYSTDFQSVEQHSTRGYRKKPPVERDRAVFDEADAASVKTADNIRITGGEMPYLSSNNDSERISPRMSTKKTSSTRSLYSEWHPTFRQRHSQPRWQDIDKLNEEMTFLPQNSTDVKTYINPSYSYSRKNRVERKNSPNRNDRASTSHRYTKSCVYLVCLLLFIVFAGALVVFTLKMDVAQNVQTVVRDVGVSFTSGCEKRKRSDRFDVLMQEQDILRQQHPTLKESAFSIIAGASFDHVDGHQELVRPVVLLLVGKQGGNTTVNDVAASVAKMYANVFSPKRYELDVVRIIGTDLEKLSSDEVRKKVHTRIEEGFRDCANVILITDLDRLPPCSAILFHGYCDNDGAPYKDAVIIFTMSLGTELPEDTKALDVEKAVQAQLDEAWSRCPEEFSSAKLVAMHSRVANNIVII